jgi:hypothetical protein
MAAATQQTSVNYQPIPLGACKPCWGARAGRDVARAEDHPDPAKCSRNSILQKKVRSILLRRVQGPCTAEVHGIHRDIVLLFLTCASR